jgi:hypothetical protein
MDTGEGVSRASTVRSRPSFTPLGPRTPVRLDHPFPRSPSTPTNLSPPPSAFSATFPSSPETRALPTPREDLQEAPTPAPQGSDTLPTAYCPLPKPAVEEPSRLPPRIPPPPKVKFESEQVEWKALPLEAALCEYRLCSTSVCGTPLMVFNRDVQFYRAPTNSVACYSVICERIFHSPLNNGECRSSFTCGAPKARAAEIFNAIKV